MAKILIVDDDKSVLEVLTTVLGIHDHDLTTVFDGEEARDHIINGEEPFDLMLSDIDMTPYNGIQMLKWVFEYRPTMPVVMMTGTSERSCLIFPAGSGSSARKASSPRSTFDWPMSPRE